MQRMIAAAFVVAGVFVLVGLGWALLAAGAVLWFRDDRAVAWIRERAGRLRPWLAEAAAMPRRSISGTSMGVGLVLAPTGVLAMAGVAAGVLTAGVLLISFAVFSGWGA
jgi:hypothetical protein